MAAAVVASAVAEPSLLKSFQGIALVMSKPTGILLDLWYDSCQKFQESIHMIRKHIFTRNNDNKYI